MSRIPFKQIKCIIYDFDGVMTDNCVIVSEDGQESVKCNRGDGLAVSKFREMGLMQAIVSTEDNMVVERRAEKLKIPVIHGVSDKEEIIKQYCLENSIETGEVMYIGNDINDLTAMELVSYTGCPADAEPEIKDIADWISCRPGGKGVIRELLSCWLCERMEDI